jgi:hypothetical protein
MVDTPFFRIDSNIIIDDRVGKSNDIIGNIPWFYENRRPVTVSHNAFETVTGPDTNKPKFMFSIFLRSTMKFDVMRQATFREVLCLRTK